MENKGPSTENEYLEAGVDAQEAGEKWRAGDSKKSTRFFFRALEIYQQGLSRFPGSFEIAFNKAQIQYELTQYPKLLAELPTSSLLSLLQEALESMRYALKLQQDNPDVLFNTGQVLSSIAEEIDSSPDSTELQPLPFLEESLELFQRCLTLQELEYTRTQEQDGSPASDNNEVSEINADSTMTISEPASNNTRVEEEEQWASVVDPVTEETLIDTINAQLDVLILILRFCSGDGRRIPWIEEYSETLINPKISTLLQKIHERAASASEKAEAQEVMQQTSIKVAYFKSFLADTNFNVERIDVATYYTTLNQLWGSINLEADFTGVVLAAQSLIAFNSSLRNHPEGYTPTCLEARWKALSTAQDILTKTSKIAGSSIATDVEKIHLLRGDVDILRFQLGQGNVTFPDAVKASSILVKNAEKFYRGAKREAVSVGEHDIAREASIKEGLAKQFCGDTNGLTGVAEVGEVFARDVLKDTLEGGIVTEKQLMAMGIQPF